MGEIRSAISEERVSKCHQFYQKTTANAGFSNVPLCYDYALLKNRCQTWYKGALEEMKDLTSNEKQTF
jgi:hypothetical protein